jgi:hypothetical protein
MQQTCARRREGDFEKQGMESNCVRKRLMQQRGALAHANSTGIDTGGCSVFKLLKCSFEDVVDLVLELPRSYPDFGF